MKKLTKVEKAILSMSNDSYNTYRCTEHGFYLIRKDEPDERQVCPYCKGKNPVLSSDEIKKMIKS